MIPTNLKLSGFQVDGVNVELATPTTLVCADVPNTTLTLKKNGAIDEMIDNTAGGKVVFNVTPDTQYTVTSSKGWSTTITTKKGENIVNVPYETSIYSVEELHTALQGGYFSVMFRAGFVVDFSTSGIEAPYNDKYFIEEIKTVDGKDQAKFRFAKKGESRPIFPSFYALKDASTTSFTSHYYSKGGYKYSEVRRLFMQKGDEVYSQVTSLKPVGSLATNGIVFNELFYTGTETKSDIYKYDEATDTFSIDNDYNGTYASPSYDNTRFMKGYFLKLGTLTQEEYNAKSHLYTYASNVYSPATAYASGTEYYGFFETMQEDGEFLKKFISIRNYMVATNDYSTSGKAGSSTILTTDFLDLASVEEITGLNKTSELVSGSSAQNANCYNNTGEGTKKQGYDGFDKQAIGSYYWTRSLHSNTSYYWCSIYNTGYVSNNYVYNTYGVRLGFILA